MVSSRLLFTFCCVWFVCSATETYENELRDLLVELLRGRLQYGEPQEWAEARPEADVGIVGPSDTRSMLRALYKTVTESSGYDVRLVSLADIWERKMIQVNTPGNRRFTFYDYNTVEAMEDGILSGHLDGALLLVKASEGVSDEIRDLVILIKASGVMDVVVFVNNDVEDVDLVQDIKLEMGLLLSAYGFESKNVVVGSLQGALNGEPAIITPLLKLVDQIPIPVRNYDKPFKMHVQFVSESDVSDSVVVYGKVNDGEVRRGDFAELLGFAESVKWVEIAGIQDLMEKDLDNAGAGDNIGITLRGVNRQEVVRGMLLAEPEGFTPANAFVAKVYLLSEDEGAEAEYYNNGETFQIRVFGANTEVTMSVDDADKIYPETKKLVRFDLDQALVMEDNAPFVLSRNDKIVGYGNVVGLLRQQQQQQQQPRERVHAYDQLRDLLGLFARP